MRSLYDHTWIFWVASPVVGPPTSLQYKSFLGVPASSWPQVAVAEIVDPSARLKYGGFKLKPVKSLKNLCPSTSLKGVIAKVKNKARKWAPLIPLAMFHNKDPSRCWEQPAASRNRHLYISMTCAKLQRGTRGTLSVCHCFKLIFSCSVEGVLSFRRMFPNWQRQLSVFQNQILRHTGAIKCQAVDGLSTTLILWEGPKVSDQPAARLFLFASLNNRKRHLQIYYISCTASYMTAFSVLQKQLYGHLNIRGRFIYKYII